MKKKALDNKKKIEKIPVKMKFIPSPKQFIVGENIRPKKDLSRFVRWPKYIKIQRQRKILFKKLKIPLVLNQFTRVLDKNLSKKIFQFLSRYKVKKKKIHRNQNKKNFIGKKKSKKNQKQLFFLKHGINNIANLVRKKKVLFVLIANDVTPIELVIWLPELCKKSNIPFCIIKNKSRLGTLVGKKKTSCVAIDSVLERDKNKIEKIITYFRKNFNKNYENLKN